MYSFRYLRLCVCVCGHHLFFILLFFYLGMCVHACVSVCMHSVVCVCSCDTFSCTRVLFCTCVCSVCDFDVFYCMSIYVSARVRFVLVFSFYIYISVCMLVCLLTYIYIFKNVYEMMVSISLNVENKCRNLSSGDEYVRYAFLNTKRN